MSSYGGLNINRHVDDSWNYRVRLSRIGNYASSDFKPFSITVFVSATSSMQARTTAQASHPGYDLIDVQEA